jgi:hypothetical protein
MRVACCSCWATMVQSRSQKALGKRGENPALIGCLVILIPILFQHICAPIQNGGNSNQ